MIKFHRSIFCTLSVLASHLIADNSWQVDLPAALQQAERENKLVLVDFTGSDWCTACIALRKNVLDTKDFRNWAADKFILVEIDLPQSKTLPDNQLEHNKTVAESYGIAAFPTVMVLNPQGEVMGGFEGFVKSTADAVAELKHAIDAAPKFSKAKLTSGTERAHLLYSIYTNYPTSKSFAQHANALRVLTQEADPDNLTGIHHHAAVQEQAQRFLEERNATRMHSPAMGTLLERQLKEALPENRPSVLMERCQYALGTAETTEDIEKTRKMFEELVPLLPAEEAAEVRHFIKTYFRDSAALLQMLKAGRSH